MDFATMQGGIDITKLGKTNGLPAPLTTSIDDHSAASMLNDDFMADYLNEESNNYNDKLTDVNIRMSPSMEKALIPTPQPDNYFSKHVVEEQSYQQPQTLFAASPVDRFKSYLANERRLNPNFAISDLDKLINYVIEQEQLDIKYNQLNKRPHKDVICQTQILKQ